ncbi:MAG: two-component system, OmpR family, sensor histidine kinase PrrB [Mycobacterium sp.]|nr:two-component system, OmpR family, sensor histidine kinase PrrB [Mycobacterium sp.]
MKRASSIRAQLSIALAGIVLVIVAAAGLAIAIRIDQRDRAQVDSAMVERSAHIEGDLDKILRDARPGAVLSSPDTFGGLLGASQSLVRVIVGGELAVERGQLPVAPIPLPGHDGFSSLVVDGDSWRSYVRTTQTRNGVQLQVLQSLKPLDERKTRNALLVLAVTAAATVLGAVVGWLVAGVLLRPLQRVRAAAVAIRDDHDTEHRLPAVRSPREVADLADTLNDMLDRLQKSAATARRFTADAGHELRTPLTSLGAYIETLNGPSEPNVELRRQITTEMAVEYRRLVDLLTGLQSLARGDSGALPAFVEVDVLEVVQDAVAAARRRHQGVVVNGPKFEEYARVLGWPDGIRLAVDNLLDNAALHGKSDGVITVRLTADHDVVSVSVDDDGPGIAAAQRPSMLKRFTRGASATASGSGLGLALVAQQAEIHRGRIDLTESAAGGLSATLTLPAERRPGR